jgi:hypothetical protein
VHIPRIASFKKAENKPGFLVPVNKRAHKLVRKLGKRTYVTAKQLAQFDGYHDIKVSHMRGGKRVLRSLSA